MTSTGDTSGGGDAQQQGGGVQGASGEARAVAGQESAKALALMGSLDSLLMSTSTRSEKQQKREAEMAVVFRVCVCVYVRACVRV